MSAFLQDVRHAARALRRSPAFALVAILSLGIGIGATSAAFSLVDALLFRPLPYADAAELVDVFEHHPTEVCAGCGVGTSYPAWLDLRDRVRSLDGSAAYLSLELTLGADAAGAGAAGATRQRAAAVSASLFPLLGVAPLRGRTFTPDEEMPGATPVVIIGERLWRARFAADDAVIDRVVRIDGVPHVVIGIMPERFALPAFAELWMPLASGHAGDSRADRSVGVIARLRDGVSLEAARAEMGTVGAGLADRFPETNDGWTMHVEPLRSELAADYAPSFWIMLGVVAFVLLVACANVANLLLARASARRHELAVRAALGGTRAVVARHLLAESLLIGLLAGAAGLLIALWALDAFRALVGGALPAWVSPRLDWRVVAFTSALGILTGLLFGILPARHATRIDLTRMLGQGGRGHSGGVTRARARNALVGIQVAAAVVLAYGAIALTAELVRILGFNVGDAVDRVYGGQVILPRGRATSPGRIAATTTELTEAFTRAAGTGDVAFSSLYIPNFPGTPRTALRVDGSDADVGSVVHRVMNVTPAYFRATGTPVIAGRSFADADVAGAAPVGIVGNALAERLWPGATPLGRRIHLGGPGDDWITIVGVVPSDRGGPFARDTARVLFVPLGQRAVARPASDRLSLHVRAARPDPALPRRLSDAAARIDADLVLEDVMSARQSYSQWIRPVRSTVLAMSALAAFAVLLAAMGIYGVIAYGVTERTAEIGVRMALGASPGGIARMVVSRAILLAGVGLVAGAAASIGLGGILRHLIVGMDGRPPLLGAIAVAFLAVAGLASWLPARRAARIDPMRALRTE